jgi:site-specific DNA-methyltransferase (adenine-specific)
MTFLRKEIIGDATLYLGRCEDVLPTLDGIDSVLADPPYGMSYRSGHNSSRRGAGAAMRRIDGNFDPIEGDAEPFDPAHVLALQVPTILWGANYYADRLTAGTRWLVWDKLDGKTPVPSGSDVELAWTSETGPSRLYTHLWRGIMRAGEENIVNGGKLHPNQKPINLMLWCLSLLGDVRCVADPYMGSGTAGVACVRTGRAFVGIETKVAYFDIACRRIEEAYRQPRLFEEPPPRPVQDKLFGDAA